jgi:hypothetical protein
MAGPLNEGEPHRVERFSPTARFAGLAVVGSVLAFIAALWIWTPALTPSDAGACRPGGDDPSQGKATAGTSRSYEWDEWQAFPPGRVCRVYAYDVELLLQRGTFPKDVDLKLIAEETYPDGAEYLWVVLAFAAPFLLAGAYRRVRSTQRASR